MFCAKCGNPGVYFRRYTLEPLCMSCLINTTQDRVRKTINKLKLLRENDRIVAAISGGKDSAVLLDLLVKIERSFPKSEVIALTIDEGIAGYRNRALEAARELTKRLEVELVVYTFKALFSHTLDEIIAHRSKNSVGACSYCGVLRRKALNAAAMELEADVVATGHNLDDEAQTFMMNIMRGDTMRIARSNRPRDSTLEGFVPRIKPISEISTRDVVAYAHFLDLPYHDAPCPYAVEAYRNDIRKFLHEMEHKRPGTLLTIRSSNELISKALGSVVSNSVYRQCEICGEPTTSIKCKACALIERLKDGD